MEKPQNYDIRYRLVFLWIIINSCIAVIIAYLLSIGIKESFKDLIVISLLTTHIVSSLAAGSGYAFGYLMIDQPLWILLPVNLVVTLTASFLGIKIVIYIGGFIGGIINIQLLVNLMNEMLIPVLIITGMISITTSSIEYFKHKKSLLIGRLNELHNKISRLESISKENNALIFRENQESHKINFDSIIFLSSSGKKTVIHTEERDYEISMLFKKIEIQLPPEIFARIHKQYIVNCSFILNMKYYKGGRYLLYLDDEDKNILPVGAKYTSILKDRITI